MNRDEIMALEAGRELDALVAEKVMGWKWEKLFPASVETKTMALFCSDPPAFGAFRVTGKSTVFSGLLPNYSTDISDAWRVVEKLEYNWNIIRDVGKCGNEYDTAGDMLYRFVYTAPGMLMSGVTAETAPLAICRAALLAVIED